MLTSRNYSPGGFTHRIHRRVSQGICSIAAVYVALGQEERPTKTKQKKMRQHIALLVQDGAVVRRDGWLEIQPYGERLLADLEARAPGGQVAPSVRIFERRAA